METGDLRDRLEKCEMVVRIIEEELSLRERGIPLSGLAGGEETPALHRERDRALRECMELREALGR